MSTLKERLKVGAIYIRIGNQYWQLHYDPIGISKEQIILRKWKKSVVMAAYGLRYIKTIRKFKKGVNQNPIHRSPSVFYFVDFKKIRTTEALKDLPQPVYKLIDREKFWAHFNFQNLVCNRTRNASR